MNAETLTALRDSIAHWERLASGERRANEGIGPNSCQLCTNFNRAWLKNKRETSCYGCPVMERTGKQFCVATPYIECERLVDEESMSLDSDAFKTAARAELDFLRSLLPVEDVDPDKPTPTEPVDNPAHPMPSDAPEAK